MKPTFEQADIRDHSATMKEGDILKVIAFAGAGKTSTLKLIAGARKERGLYLAFNRDIAAEAKRKFALTKCSASTMHALALQAVTDIIGKPTEITAKSIRNSGIMNQFHVPIVQGWNNYRVASAVGRTLSEFCNSDSEEFLVEHGEAALISVLGHPDLIRDKSRKIIAEDAMRRLARPLAEMAEAVWHQHLERSEMNFDMLLKVLDLDSNLRSKAFSTYRYLMVDEAQDLNPVQRSIILKTGLPIIAVGDPYQQIYSWRGAENALQVLPGTEKFLTQSFRFGEDIAEVARHILRTRPDGGPKQRLIGAGNGKIANHEGSKIGIVCRTNMGVLDEAIKFMRRGIPLYVAKMPELMKDVRSAQALYNGDLKGVTTKAFQQFESWEELCMEAEESDASLKKVVDIIEGEMVGDIENLSTFMASDPKKAKVTICTSHASKGLEWPAVQLGGDWKDVKSMGKRYRKSLTQSESHKTLAIEEWNTLYVGATRAMVRLKGHDRICFPDLDDEMDDEPAMA